MHYVYLIRSVSHPQETYVGMTSNLRDRLKKHNSGSSVHTSEFIP